MRTFLSCVAVSSWLQNYLHILTHQFYINPIFKMTCMQWGGPAFYAAQDKHAGKCGWLTAQ